MDCQAELKAARTRLRMTGQDMADYLGLKSCNAYRSKERGQGSFTNAEKAKLTTLFKWDYRMMNDVLYGGVLPDFDSDGHLKE